MLYQCSKCQKQFIHLSKQIITSSPTTYLDLRVDYTTTNADSIPKVTVTTTNETFVCPYCSSNEYTEIKEQTPDIEAVYIYDLTSGPQDALNVLLADGYKIVSRYAKQYFLEKPKVEPAKDYVTEAVEKAKEAK